LPAIKTQLYTIPPWAAAFGFCLIFATLSDRLRHRFAFALVSSLVTIAGLIILLLVSGPQRTDVQYGAMFLITSGTYTAMPTLVCWFTMNLSGHKRRSIGTAWQIAFGNSTSITSHSSVSCSHALL
jgi:peroxin-3